MMVNHKMMKCSIPAANNSLCCAIGKRDVIWRVVCRHILSPSFVAVCYRRFFRPK